MNHDQTRLEGRFGRFVAHEARGEFGGNEIHN